MKHVFMLLLMVCAIFATSFAQAPKGIYYESVVRDNFGNLVQNKPVSLRFSIHNNTPTGAIIFQQTDTVITDQMGLITVVLGGGSITLGNFNNINWASGAKYVQQEMDINGGVQFVNMGTTQMLSVPYALYAASAGNTDTLWTAAGNNIQNTNAGVVAVTGFTQLGSNAPKIQMMQLSGLTPSIAGNSTILSVGIPDSNIVSVNVLVTDPINGLIAPLSALTGTQYTYTVLSSTFRLTTSLTNSLAILNKPFKALIIYKQ